jgi:hypothetical protein
MGGFINSQADNEICEVLNKRFSDQVDPNDGRTYIAQVRDHFQHREKFLDANHHLHRVFHRLAISVTGVTRVPRIKNSRFRWLFLLRSTLPDAVKKAIRDQLTAILSAPTTANPAGATDYATFSTQHAPTTTGARFELDIGNNSTPTIQNDANGKRYCAIILRCNVDAKLDDSPNETDPPTADSGETTFAVRKRASPRAAKKSSAKKSSAKKSSGKKTAAKKRKSKVR